MSRRRGNGIAAFIAGFGTGYLNSKNQAYERERQEKIDRQNEEERELRMKNLKREDAKAERVEDLENEIAAIPDKTYKNKTSMTADELRGMVGGSANPEDANYVSDEAAKQYNENNIGAGQVNSNAAYYAKEGVGNNLGGKIAVDDASGETKLAKPEDGVKRAPWKILEEGAKKRISSGIAEQAQLGYAALAQAVTMKSQAIKDGMAKAMAEPGDPAVNLIKFASNWDNEDFEFTDMRLDKSGDADRPKLYAKKNGEGDEILLRDYSKLNLPKGMTVVDAMKMELETLIDPSKMFEQARANLTMKREDARQEKTDARLDKQDQRADEELNMKKELQPFAISSAASTAKVNGVKARYAEEEAQAGIEASRSMTAKNNYETGGGDGIGKPLTTAEKTKSSEVNAARTRIKNLKPEDLKFIKEGDIGMNAAVSPKQKQIQEAYNKAMEPDPAMVRVYGTDPHLERFSAGQPPYKQEPLPPPAKRKEGATYEMADGTQVIWDGKGLKPKR